MSQPMSQTMSMPFPLFENACFDPEATKLMGEIFEEMVQSLGRVGRPRVIQEAIARQIIEAVQDGERDRDAIYQRVLAALALKLRLWTPARRCA
jgi:hypothetical protein